MKINWADIPVNIFDAVDRYQRTSVFWVSFSAGVFLAATYRADWWVAGTAAGFAAVGVVLAYYVGRES